MKTVQDLIAELEKLDPDTLVLRDDRCYVSKLRPFKLPRTVLVERCEDMDKEYYIDVTDRERDRDIEALVF